tara:strand:+ start:693 stop:1115 length:423 start_codon:yes stop_codon:yes gene_type:complete
VEHKVNDMKIDKRTKEYKEMMKAKKSEGLGDTIEKVLEKTGVAKVAKFLLGEDCGCDERKEKLNKMFPYYKPLCLEEEEYKFLTDYFERGSKVVRIQEQRDLLKIYNRVFRQKNPRTTTDCSSCVREMVGNLQRVYREYT